MSIRVFRHVVRQFSHVTKSRILKNLCLRRKADHNFCGNLLASHFRHLNYIQITWADWPEVVVIWAPFERQKVEVYFFDKANISGFAAWKCAAKEDLNPQKQVFLLNLRLWAAQKRKICVKAKGFWFKN